MPSWRVLVALMHARQVFAVRARCCVACYTCVCRRRRRRHPRWRVRKIAGDDKRTAHNGDVFFLGNARARAKWSLRCVCVCVCAMLRNVNRRFDTMREYVHTRRGHNAAARVCVCVFAACLFDANHLAKFVGNTKRIRRRRMHSIKNRDAARHLDHEFAHTFALANSKWLEATRARVRGNLRAGQPSDLLILPPEDRRCR